MQKGSVFVGILLQCMLAALALGCGAFLNSPGDYRSMSLPSHELHIERATKIVTAQTHVFMEAANIVVKTDKGYMDDIDKKGTTVNAEASPSETCTLPGLPIHTASRSDGEESSASLEVVGEPLRKKRKPIQSSVPGRPAKCRNFIGFPITKTFWTDRARVPNFHWNSFKWLDMATALIYDIKDHSTHKVIVPRMLELVGRHHPDGTGRQDPDNQQFAMYLFSCEMSTGGNLYSPGIDGALVSAVFLAMIDANSPVAFRSGYGSFKID